MCSFFGSETGDACLIGIGIISGSETRGAAGLTIGEFSIKTGVTFSRFDRVFTVFLGNVSLIESPTRMTPERIMKVVFQNDGKPKNGIRKMKIPRKNVLFLFIMRLLFVLYTRKFFKTSGHHIEE